jgi:beta-lactamase regulating signal transducer with metallopeptidase domain
MIGELVNHLWQSTLFCAAVWLITLALRHNGAALRHSLWLVASLKFLVPFSALHLLGAEAGLPAPVGVQPTFFTHALELTAPVVSPTRSLIMLSPLSAASWTTMLVALWAVGAGMVGLRWWMAWRAADSVARAARPAPGAPPDTRVTDAAIEPAVARVFRPVVLLPAALLGRLSSAQLAAVLAHERQHITRRDNLVAHLHRLVETLFWFHPLVWWIGHRIVEERELACDEAVLANGHDAADYAEGILAVCRHCQHGRVVGAASALSGDLTRRIRAIVRDAAPMAPGLLKTLVLSLTGLAIATGPLLAGAVDGAMRRSERLAKDSRVFRSAQIFVAPAADIHAERGELTTAPRIIVVRNTSLRELVALTYGVSPVNVEGGGEWLDAPRYDIRAELRDPLSSPAEFDPAALRGAVIELLASRFDLRVHVNQRCQAPCGRRALKSPSTTT